MGPYLLFFQSLAPSPPSHPHSWIPLAQSHQAADIYAERKRIISLFKKQWMSPVKIRRSSAWCIIYIGIMHYLFIHDVTNFKIPRSNKLKYTHHSDKNSVLDPRLCFSSRGKLSTRDKTACKYYY